MPTLEENVNRVKAAKTAIGSAITAKGGTVGANDGLEDFAADIATIPSGGGGTSQPRKDVNFYDYDGTIVDSYTAAEFAELTAMPDNPSHEGLTAQGWNWSLSDAKAYVADYGKLEIGQMYVTSDGKTRIYITLTEGRTSPTLGLYLNANSELDIDWGDESTHSTITSESAAQREVQHNYANEGEYIIEITIITGSIRIYNTSNKESKLLTDSKNNVNSSDRYYLNAIKKIEIGSSVESIENYALYYCSSLTTITIPRNTIIGYRAFGYCHSLRSITISTATTVISYQAFFYCYSLSSISIPNSVISIDTNAFFNCGSLMTITIPNTVTSINSNAFSSCYSLATITMPNSITSIDTNVFNSSYGLATITIDKAEGSISGSPWGAPSETQIIWTGE